MTKNSQTKSSFNFRKSFRKILGNGGAILLEFALAIPVLIILFYYTHDLLKLARMHERMELCAHCAVNMFQNISQKREDKKITNEDFRYISCIAFLPYFGGGVNQYGAETINTYPLGYFGEMSLYYVKGMGNNRAKIIWGMVAEWGQPPPSRMVRTNGYWKHVTVISVNFGVEYNAADIHKDLRIQADEVKIIVNICLHHLGQGKEPSYWKLYLLTPKMESSEASFHKVVIFTPKSELFDENLPK